MGAGNPAVAEDAAIVVSNVSKTFEMQSDRRDTFKERFVRGKAKTRRERFHALNDVSFSVLERIQVSFFPLYIKLTQGNLRMELVLGSIK